MFSHQFLNTILLFFLLDLCSLVLGCRGWLFVDGRRALLGNNVGE